MNKLKILQVNPGLLPIGKFNGWGAIERVIANYVDELSKLGHQCDINYIDNINTNDYDIIHCHTGMIESDNTYISFGKFAKERNIKYIFSLHDHHIAVDDYVLNMNIETINNAEMTIIHGKNMYSYLPNNKNIFYVPHGVDSKFKLQTKKRNNSLLCVGNNGLATNPLIDRKGFLPAVDFAKKHGFPITFACPASNKKFFETYKEKFYRDNVTILYDLSDDELIKLYNTYSIFLHFSTLEAGQPNLTLLEASMAGMPIIGNYNNDPEISTIFTPNTDSEATETLNKIFANYNEYSDLAHKEASRFSWANAIRDIELLYFNALNRRNFANTIKSVYDNAKQSEISKKNRINISYLDGAKVEILGPEKDDYFVEFINADTNEILYSSTIQNNMWSAPMMHYFVNWKIRINGEIIDELNLFDKNILISFESSSLGDTLAWIGSVQAFKDKHNCNITISTHWNSILKDTYNDLIFVEPGVNLSKFYAWYKIGCYDSDFYRNKRKWNMIPLISVAEDILDVKHIDRKLIVNSATKYTTDTTDKPLIAISTAATAKAKEWNYPHGWQILIDILSKTYDIAVLQKEECNFNNVIKYTTGIDIHETIDILKDAKFFIGLGSGVSWLANALNVPVILISGFSSPETEFYTPYRIINTDYCNSCYNDPRYEFDRNNWNWCPRNKDFECTKSIYVEDILKQIEKIENDN